MHDETRAASCLCCTDVSDCRRGGASAANSDDAAFAGGLHQRLHAAETCSATRHHRAGGHYHRPGERSAFRPAREIQWRVMSARRHRSANACAGARSGQHASHPAARQPERQSERAAEIGFCLEQLAARGSLLDRAESYFLYAARSRPRHRCRVFRRYGGVAQLVRARES